MAMAPGGERRLGGWPTLGRWDHWDACPMRRAVVLKSRLPVAGMELETMFSWDDGWDDGFLLVISFNETTR